MQNLRLLPIYYLPQFIQLLRKTDVHQSRTRVISLHHQLQQLLLLHHQLFKSRQSLPLPHLQLFLQKLLVRMQRFRLLYQPPNYFNQLLLRLCMSPCISFSKGNSSPLWTLYSSDASSIIGSDPPLIYTYYSTIGLFASTTTTGYSITLSTPSFSIFI